VAAEYEVNIKINTRDIETQLGKIDKAVNNIGKSRGGKKQPVLALPSTEMLNATLNKIQSLDKVNRKIELRQKEINKQTRDQALNIDTLVKTQDRRARLLNKINEMEAKGLNVSKLRKQLGKATNEQSARRFGSAEKEFRVLEKSIRLEQSKLRILKEQRKGFASSPVRGTRTMMGSPAQIAATGRQIASPIRGGLDFPGSPAYLAGRTVSRRPFGPAFPASGISSPIRGGVGMAGSPAQMQAIKKIEMAELRADKNAHFAELKLIQKRQKMQLDNVDKLFAKNIKNLETFNKKLAASDAAREKRLAGGQIPRLGRGQTYGPGLAPMQGPRQMIASPVGGAPNIPGSPAFLRRQRMNRRLGQIGLGAGFPLLFGGGAGSVIGGAAGGAFGSFGAQIALSAAGQMVDQFVASVMEAGKAFGSLSTTLDLMRERSLFTSKESEELARKLEELGDVEGLAELATVELASKIGSEGIEAFQDLETEIDEFDRLTNNLIISLQAFLAGPLAGFLEIVNATLGRQVTEGTVNRLKESIQDPVGRANFVAAARRQIGTETVLKGFSAGIPQSEEVFKSAPLDVLGQLSRDVAAGKYGKSSLTRTKLKVTQSDRDSIKPPKDRSASRAARQEAQLQKRLAQLEEERQKILAISAFKDKIAAAEAVSDDQLVVRLQGEQRIAEIEASRRKDLIDITDQREIDAINIGKATEKLAAQQDTERQLNALQVSRNKLFTDTVENLEHELKMAQAVTEEEKERLRIQLQLKKLQKDGLDQGQIEEIEGLLNKIAEENSPLSQAIKQTQQQINDLLDPVKQLISLADTLGNAFSESFRGLVSGSMTAREALANLFQRTADHFLDMAAQMIAAQIKMQILNIGLNFFGGMGGGGNAISTNSLNQIKGYSGVGANTPVPLPIFGQKALGGSVSGNRPYLVGERGPELFVPGAQGNIVPNNAMGSANVTVNVDASGSSVEGDSEQASQLGKMLGAAVQAELIKQKRPGGLLA